MKYVSKAIVFLLFFSACMAHESAEQQQWKVLNQKAYACLKSGKLYQGVEWMEESCEYATKNFGENHPDTLTSINNLILFYVKQGRKSDIVPLYKKLITGAKVTFGDKHPFTLTSIERLANLYISLGNLNEAAQRYEELLEIKTNALGKDHPHILKILINLAALHSGLKHMDHAESFYLKIINFKPSIQKNHPEIIKARLNARADLARMYESIDQPELAEKQYQYLYQYYSQTEGEQHDATLRSLQDLAQHYSLNKNDPKALNLFEKGYEICKANRKDTDPIYFVFQKNRAILYIRLNKGAAAEQPIQKAYEKSVDLYGQTDANTIMLLYYIGIQHEKMGRTQQAKECLERALDQSRSIFGPSHLLTETIDSHLRMKNK
ncbi:MAG: hypothetical protein OMM_00712 [Candidatus Magnetoglobus multicellularis str. Araruama]|uniref:TPR repeat-containing protein n=1 Tax=Candidatus Magnetoglobus multicellularis str. Araruama TaxID=890399 RepID=A0A1V1PFW2_9BACT|nr:MAG: hypothetical protein OMM_00712 [Candidatus Magnetoglobus multicellularis str. Araruama]